MAVYNGLPIQDRDLPKISADHAVRYYVPNFFPWLFSLETGSMKTGVDNDVYHHWQDDPEGLASTGLAANMAGGATQEVITVASTEHFHEGNTVRISQNAASVAGQNVRILNIANATTMTVAAISGNLEAHEAGARIILTGSYMSFMDDLTVQPLRHRSRQRNAIELIEAMTVITSIMADAKDLSDESFMAQFYKDLVSNFKQKLTGATLVGDMVSNLGDGVGKMEGAINIIAGGGNEIGFGSNPAVALTKANLREFVRDIHKRGGFPTGTGRCYHNADFRSAIYSWDDESAVSQLRREREDFFDKARIFGITMDMIEEPWLDQGFPQTPFCMFVSPVAKSGPNLRLVRKSNYPLGDGTPKEVLKQTHKFELQCARPYTIEVRNPYMHGVAAWLPDNGS